MDIDPKSPALLGIFDSGVGGFSVYKKIRNATQANCIYYGDCARAPYGNRDEVEIINYIKEDISFLQEKGVTHFVNACNSMSVFTTDVILNECRVSSDMYIDMIRAFDRHAIFEINSVVLVIATVATIRSGCYQEVLMRKGVTVFEFAYTDLASAIENNLPREELLEIIKKAIAYALVVGATHIVYGCTHYPLAYRWFNLAKEEKGWKGEFIDPAVYVAVEVKKWGLQGERTFLPYSSKDTPNFIRNVIKFL